MKRCDGVYILNVIGCTDELLGKVFLFKRSEVSNTALISETRAARRYGPSRSNILFSVAAAVEIKMLLMFTIIIN